MTRACEKCHRHNDPQPRRTPGGFLLGHLCDRCLARIQFNQSRTERCLEARRPRRHPKPRPPRGAGRRFPTARRIAAELPAEMLVLRTRTLVADIRWREGVAISTAMHAIALARSAAA